MLAPARLWRRQQLCEILVERAWEEEAAFRPGHMRRQLTKCLSVFRADFFDIFNQANFGNPG